MRKKLYSLFEKDSAYLDGTWHDIPIIMGTTGDLDEDSEPNDYILLRWDVSNTTKVFGDGLSKLRQSNCDIMILTSGANTVLHSKLEIYIEELLYKNEITYTMVNLGFNADISKTQTTFAVVTI